MNFLFASIEDLNDWIEPLGGHPQARTPNLNRLASRGMVFRNAYATVPACSPSRTATLFGQAPWQTGVYTNSQFWSDHYPAGQRRSIIGAMRDAGYATIGAGKIFHMDVRGIDAEDWSEFNTAAKHKKYPPISQTVKTRELRPMSDFGPDPTSDPYENFDAANTDWLCRKIQPGQDRQFWAFGLYRPHLPFIVPQEYFDLYPPVVDPPPGLGRKKFNPNFLKLQEGLPRESLDFINRRIGWVLHRMGEYNDFLRAYLASISYADALFGKVLDRLEETGQIDNTIIVLWSDHGWQFGEKLAFRKFTLWERALRVPLMIAGPGVEKGECREPVSLLDLYPTLCHQSGATAKHELSGEDFSPVLAGEQWQRREPVISIWGKWEKDTPDGGRVAFSLRNKTHRYSCYWNGGEELYESESDPFEHINLLAHNTAGGNLRALADSYQAQIDRMVPELAEVAGWDG